MPPRFGHRHRSFTDAVHSPALFKLTYAVFVYRLTDTGRHCNRRGSLADTIRSLTLVLFTDTDRAVPRRAAPAPPSGIQNFRRTSGNLFDHFVYRAVPRRAAPAPLGPQPLRLPHHQQAAGGGERGGEREKGAREGRRNGAGGRGQEGSGRGSERGTGRGGGGQGEGGGGGPGGKGGGGSEAGSETARKAGRVRERGSEEGRESERARQRGRQGG